MAETERFKKYVLQVSVANNSWALSEDELNEMEQFQTRLAAARQEYQEYLAEKAAEEAGPKGRRKQPARDRSAGRKGKKGDKDKDKDSADERAAPPPVAPAFDASQPHFALRLIGDAALAADLELRRDTERADEIAASKRAWEELESGRAEAAAQSRAKYIAEQLGALPNLQELLAPYLPPPPLLVPVSAAAAAERMSPADPAQTQATEATLAPPASDGGAQAAQTDAGGQPAPAGPSEEELAKQRKEAQDAAVAQLVARLVKEDRVMHFLPPLDTSSLLKWAAASPSHYIPILIFPQIFYTLY